MPVSCAKLPAMTPRALPSRPPQVRAQVPLHGMTTMGVGGPAAYFAEADSAEAFCGLRRWAEDRNLPVLVLGEGSNVLIADKGFSGLVIRNAVSGVRIEDAEAVVGGAENLPRLIRLLNRRRLGGLERMYGIPGTVAGAVVGNAGAYGQEICERVVQVRAWTPEGVRVLPPDQLDFRYRHSIFKQRREWFLLECRLRLIPSSGNLQQVSDTILEKRLHKYPPGLRCPGSFFKNVIADELPEAVRRRLPPDFFFYGKVPAGKLLEAVGANGAVRGGAQIASYHGNLVINRGGATSREIRELAFEYAERVHHRYRIRLEPEILILSHNGEILG